MPENNNQELFDSLNISIESKNKVKTSLEQYKSGITENKTFNNYGDILTNIFVNEMVKIDLKKSIQINIAYYVPGKGLQYIKQSVEQMFDINGNALNKIDLNQSILRNNIKGVPETILNDTTDILMYNPQLVFDGFISPYPIDVNNILDFNSRMSSNDGNIVEDIVIGAVYKNFHENRFYCVSSLNDNTVVNGTVTKKVINYNVTNGSVSNIKIYWCNKSTNYTFVLLAENQNVGTDIIADRAKELSFDFTYNQNTKNTIFYLECSSNIENGFNKITEYSNFTTKEYFNKVTNYSLFFAGNNISHSFNEHNSVMISNILIPRNDKFNFSGITINNYYLETLILTKIESFELRFDSGVMIRLKNIIFNQGDSVLKKIDILGYINIEKIVFPKNITVDFNKINIDLGSLKEFFIDTLLNFKGNIFSELVFAKINRFSGNTIPDNLFNNCWALTKFETSLIMGIDIGQNAFKNCGKLNVSNNLFMRVSSIGLEAFKNSGTSNIDLRSCSANFSLIVNQFQGNTNIIQVLLPNTIVDIPDGCFDGCVNLTSINLGNIKTLGQNAFKNCEKLISLTDDLRINIDSPLEKIGDYCFNGCVKLTNIVLPNKLKTIGINSFSDCPKLKLTDITLPQLTSIGDYAFVGCNIFDINIHHCSELISMGNGIFDNTGLLNINISDCPKLTSIGTEFFTNQYVKNETIKSILLINLPLFNSRLIIPKSINKLTIDNLPLINGDSLYLYNSKISEITLSNLPKVKYLLDSSFQNCINLIKCDLSGLTIGFILYKWCFCGDSNLREVILPKNTKIASHCFESCANIENIYGDNLSLYWDSLNPNINDNNRTFPNCKKLKNIDNISFGATEKLFDRIFAYSGIKKIVIPNSISQIADNCFLGCNNLRYYIFERITPPILTSASSLYLSPIYNTKIFVPDVSIETYQTSTNWAAFKYNILPISLFDENDFFDDEKIIRFTYYKSGVGYVQKDYICSDKDKFNGYYEFTLPTFFSQEIVSDIDGIALIDKDRKYWNPGMTFDDFSGAVNITKNNTIYNIPISKNKVTPIGVKYKIVDDAPRAGFDTIYVMFSTKYSNEFYPGTSFNKVSFNFYVENITAANPLIVSYDYCGAGDNIWITKNHPNNGGGIADEITYTTTGYYNYQFYKTSGFDKFNTANRLLRIRFNKPIIITETLNDTVRSIFIGKNAILGYYNCFANYNNLETLVLEENKGVNKICDEVFRNCKNLKHLVLNDNYKTQYGFCFFNGCKFKSLIIPYNNNTVYGDYCFQSCSVEDFLLPKNPNPRLVAFNYFNINNINDDLFISPSPINTETTSNIFRDTFSYSNMEKIFFTKNIDRIYPNVFANSKIKKLMVIAGSSGIIDTLAFQFSYIQTIFLQGNWLIENKVFIGCKNLKTFICTELRGLGPSCFADCIALDNIDLPSTLMGIGELCFQDCVNLRTFICRTITPPTLGPNAFSGCNLIRIYVPDASLQTYKTATNWVSYADRIYSINTIVKI